MPAPQQPSLAYRLKRSSPLRAPLLHAATARRTMARYGIAPTRALAPIDERAVFVVGSPRSGTSFTAEALGGVSGFADLGEVNALKVAIPSLANAAPTIAARRVRRLLVATQRLGCVGGLRAIEQTPESTFIIPALARAFPRARFIHAVRDGRDVVCSLLQLGWLGRTPDPARVDIDDAGQPFGSHARFWVERERREQFEAVSEARRAAWVWRRYEETAAEALESLPGRTFVLRYEALAKDHQAVASELASFLDARDRGGEIERELSRAHGASVGRYARDLTDAQLADVQAEAGALLRKLGYSDTVPQGSAAAT